jgi:hypothetical protein
MTKIKGFNEFLFEAVPQKDMYKYEITCRDPDGTLKDMIEHIGKLGNTGHSFSIIVDPDITKEEGKRTFEWDGDGSDYIHEVKVIQEPIK